MGELIQLRSTTSRRRDALTRTRRLPPGCPECGRHDGKLSTGAEIWGYCGRHQVKWLVGRNDAWRDESPEAWSRNAAQLERMHDVEPLAPGDGLICR